jgi:anti-sigma regulatory factor (Ser/Thr protein kinase)
MSQNGARHRTAAPSGPAGPTLPGATPVGRWELARADDLPLLRRAVLGVVLRVGTGEPDPRARGYDTLALVATELATNALKYGSPPATMRIYRVEGGWILDVTDSRPDRRPVRQEPQPGRPGGNGLIIVERLSKAWGWYPDDDGAHKHVWARISA